MTTQTQTKKEQYAKCEECERMCYTGGEHEEEYICEDCDEDCDSEASGGEYECRKCGEHTAWSYIFEGGDCYNYCDTCLAEMEEKKQIVKLRLIDGEMCAPQYRFVEEEEDEDDDDEDLAYDCEVCGKHLYITEMAKCEWRELCASCCVGRQEDCDCPVCEDNNKEEEEPTFDDLLGDDRLDFSNPTNVAQFTAFVQANFTREEIFPETKPIITSDSISGEVSRELETLQAQNARLVAENQRLQQQLQSIKSLLHAN